MERIRSPPSFGQRCNDTVGRLTGWHICSTVGIPRIFSTRPPQQKRQNTPHPAHAPDLRFVRRNRFFFGAQSGEVVNKLSKAIENQQMGLKEVEERILQFLYHSPARSFNRGTSPLFQPIQLQFSMIYSTVSEIEVDQLLVRNSGLARHVFEVRDGIPIKSNGKMCNLELMPRSINRSSSSE